MNRRKNNDKKESLDRELGIIRKDDSANTSTISKFKKSN